MSDDAKKSLRCSFCGKHEQQVHRMIQGPGVRICDECVRLCTRILGEEFEDEEPAITEDIPDHAAGLAEFRVFQIHGKTLLR